MTEQLETVGLNTPCLVWSIHPSRAKWHLTNQDIIQATNTFKEKTGQVATNILLHPLTQKYGLTPPDGVAVHYSFRVLAHDVFLPLPDGVGLPTAPERQRASVTKPPKPSETINPTLDLLKGGRKPLQKPVKRATKQKDVAKVRIMQHLPLKLIPVSKRGRPLKRGEVHRSTEWRRRQKAKQVVMM